MRWWPHAHKRNPPSPMDRKGAFLACRRRWTEGKYFSQIGNHPAKSPTPTHVRLFSHVFLLPTKLYRSTFKYKPTILLHFSPSERKTPSTNLDDLPCKCLLHFFASSTTWKETSFPSFQFSCLFSPSFFERNPSPWRSLLS